MPAETQKVAPTKILIPAAVCVLLALHVFLGISLIDEELLLVPDAAEYLIGARALATGNGYHDLSNPSLPLLYRPIGTSALLAPIVGWRGYDVIAAKTVLLCFSVGVCLVGFMLARSIASIRIAFFALFLLVISPVMLIHGSRIYSQVPYAFFVTSVVCLISTCEASTRISWGRLILVAVTAVAADKTRAEGIILWPALLAWTTCGADRRRRFVTILIAGSVSLGIDLLPFTPNPWLNFMAYRSVAAPNAELATNIRSASAAAAVYSESLAAILVPAWWPGLQWFGFESASMTPLWLKQGVGLLAVSLAAWGVCRRARDSRRLGESLATGLFIAGTFAILLLWPHRMSRLAYPVFPLLSIYFIDGASRLVSGKRSLAVAVAIIAIQSGSAGRFILEYTPPPSTGRATRQAGRWIDANTPSWTRVTTDRKQLFFTSHRFQEFFFPHDISLEEFNRRLYSVGARYAWFTSWESDRRLYGNPTFVFEPESTDVGARPIWRIEPNHTGVVRTQSPWSPRPPQLDDDEQPSALAASLLKQASWLEQTGARADAVGLLRRHLVNRSAHAPGTTDLWIKLGHLLLAERRPAEAIDCYQRAKTGIYSDLYGGGIDTSITVAIDLARAHDRSVSGAERAEIFERMARATAATARWSDALALCDQALNVDEHRISARLLRILILRRLGHRNQALQEAHRVFTRLRLVIANAQERRTNSVRRDVFLQSVLVYLPQAVDQDLPRRVQIDDEVVVFDPSDRAQILELADLCCQDDLRGVALRILEFGCRRYPQDPKLIARFAEELIVFGQFERAQQRLADAQQRTANIQRIGKLLQLNVERSPDQ